MRVPSVEWVMITSSCPLVILSAVVLEPRATWTKLSIYHHMAIPGQEEAPCLDGTYFVSSLDAPCSSSSKVKSVWAPALLFSPSAPEDVLCPPTYVPTPAITAPAQPTQAEGEAAPDSPDSTYSLPGPPEGRLYYGLTPRGYGAPRCSGETVHDIGAIHQ